MTAQVKPNVIYILVDNWGWADIQIQGGSIPTPRINALANDGLRLTNFNVESQCTPTRSAIMTGRLPIRSGTHRVTYGLPYGMAPWEYTLPNLFSDAGYATALFGKWHLGRQGPRSTSGTTSSAGSHRSARSLPSARFAKSKNHE